MGLINGKQGNFSLMKKTLKTGCQQPLRCSINKVQPAFDHLRRNPLSLLIIHAGIYKSRLDANLLQCVNLILHQRYERRNHNTHAWTNQSRNLKTQRLTASSGHKGKDITPLKQVLNYLTLMWPELSIAKKGV